MLTDIVSADQLEECVLEEFLPRSHLLSLLSTYACSLLAKDVTYFCYKTLKNQGTDLSPQELGVVKEIVFSLD